MRRESLSKIVWSLAALLLLLACIETCRGQELQPTLPTPGDAVGLIFPDFLALDEVSQVYARYLWVPSGTIEEAQVLSFAVNNISRNSTPYRPAILRDKPDGKLIVLRIDLRRIAEDEGPGLDRYLQTWESLANDPWFRYSNLGPGRIVKPATKEEIVKCEKCRGFGHFSDKSKCKICSGTGKVTKIVAVDGGKIAVVEKFLPGLHAGGAGPALLMADLGGSDAMIVHGGFFAIRALGELDYGFGNGLYRKFHGTDGKTQGEIFAFVGADESTAEKLQSDQRLVQVSNVTGRVRVAKFARAIGGAAVARSMGIVMWTEDPSRKNYDTAHDAFLNLLDVKFDAVELFASMPNGLVYTDLFDAQGKQQEFAPGDIAPDRRTPEPHSTELNAGVISCGRCHGRAVYGMAGKEAAFFQPLVNEARDMLTQIEPDVDFSALGMTRDEYYKRVSGLFEWEPELDVLPLSRIFYSRAVAGCTDYGDGPLTTREAWDGLATLHDHYAFARVDATEALRQLGYELPMGMDAIETLTDIVETDDESLPVGITFNGRLKRADPTVALLKVKDPFSGDPRLITAVQWSQVYASAAYKSVIRHPERILRGDRP